MALKIKHEFRLHLVRENPATYATDRWDINGDGDGQKEFAQQMQKYSDAEITLYVREVVISDWVNSKPDEECTGQGYAHKAHGKCPGFATDRT